MKFLYIFLLFISIQSENITLDYKIKQFCVQGPSIKKWECDKGDKQKTKFIFKNNEIFEYVNDILYQDLMIRNQSEIYMDGSYFCSYQVAEWNKVNDKSEYISVYREKNGKCVYVLVFDKDGGGQKFKFYN